jgi:RimJ/RimL family protein N-acetyltransferase
MSTDNELHALYAETMRRNTHVPGMVREEAPHVVRYSAPHGSMRYILWHDIPAAQLFHVVAREIAQAKKIVGALCWRIHANDAPASLPDYLKSLGFMLEPPALQHFIAPQVLLENLALRHAVAAPVRARELTRPEELPCYLPIWNEAFPDSENQRYMDDAIRAMRAGERGVRYFAAFDGPQAIGSGSLVHPPGAPMALLTSGAVRAAWQKRGAYHALIQARAEAAIDAGISILCVDASAQSTPILQKLGFVPQGEVRFYEMRFADAM